MNVGDLVLDWYWPGVGIIIEVLEDEEGPSEGPSLVRVYFVEGGVVEYRYDHEVVVINELR